MSTQGMARIFLKSKTLAIRQAHHLTTTTPLDCLPMHLKLEDRGYLLIKAAFDVLPVERRGVEPRPLHCERSALPTELPPLVGTSFV